MKYSSKLSLPKRLPEGEKKRPGKRRLAWKAPPFKLERESSVPMTQQLRNGFAEAIESGYYKPGEVLPTLRDISEIFGVSMSIVLDVVEYLVADGYVRPRPRLGTIVLSRGERSYLGHAIVIVPGMLSSYYGSVFANSFAEKMEEKGYSVSILFLSADSSTGKYDLDRIDKALNKYVSIVVAIMPTKEIVEKLEKSSSPFIVMSDALHDFPGSAGSIRRERYGINHEILAHCKERNIKTATQFIFESITDELPVFHGFSDPLISVETVRFQSEERLTTVGQVRRLGYDGFMRYYAEKKGVLPELIVVSDDVLATGVIMAIEHLRINVPEQTKLLVFSHKGNDHCVSFRYGQIQMDPSSDGQKTAEEILNYLRNNKYAISFSLPPRFIPWD